MPLSLYMNKLPGSNKRHSIKQPSAGCLAIAFGRQIMQMLLIMLAATIPRSYPLNAKRRHHWVSIVGLCAVLVLLGGAGGSNTTDRLDFVDSNKMLKTLQWLGFAFYDTSQTITVLPYTPSRSDTPIFDHNLVSLAPRYIIDYQGPCVYFQLPEYLDEDETRVALVELANIAVIRSPHSCRIWVTSAEHTSARLLLNLQIISRVIHMIDCAVLVLCFDSGLSDKKCVDVFGLATARIEALKTICHADYTTPCQVQFSTSPGIKLFNLSFYGIVVLRPISHVNLSGREINHTHLLTQISLIEDYLLSFTCLPKTASIDLEFLQRLSAKCGQVNISGSAQTKLTLVGLMDESAVQLQLVLEITWQLLQYLGRHNPALIFIHTILGLNINTRSIQLMRQAIQQEVTPTPRIFAAKAIFMVDFNMPCGSLDLYRNIYTREACTKYGMAVNEVQIKYTNPRLDLLETLKTLWNIKALIRIPSEVQGLDVICDGDFLNVPGWKVKESVLIQLSLGYLDTKLSNYKAQGYLCFCQNIRYTVIEIDGIGVPSESLPTKFIAVLALFRNITAQKLKILNLRVAGQFSTNLHQAIIKLKADDQSQYRLEIQTLVLDNVDGQVVYSLLMLYAFVGPTEIHLRNQHFSNLAIAQILAHPPAQNISQLWLSDFLELNEVKNCHQREKIKGFSLFRYIKNKTKEGMRVEDLGLHKLFLRVDGTDVSFYSELLYELWSFGIQFPCMSFETYLASTSTHSKRLIFVAREEFVLYNVSLSAITAAFIDSQAINLTQAQLESIPRRSVKSLVLCFNYSHPLTEPQLVTVLRWIAYEFTDMNFLRLININMPSHVRCTIKSRNYMVMGLEQLKAIIIEPTKLNEPPTNVKLRLYGSCLLANVSNYQHEITIVSRRMLARLAAMSDKQLDRIAPKHAVINTPLQMVINDCKNNKDKIFCPICYKSLYTAPKKLDTNAKEADPALPVAEFSSDNNFELFCYFTCGHAICNECGVQLLVREASTCPLCRHELVYRRLRDIRAVSAFNFVFASGSTSVPFTSLEWLKRLTWGDSQIYFYPIYHDNPIATDNFATYLTQCIHIV
ncbi:hypothetical protein NEHOM01_0430 [Nematocida homosporus]|uniref:uncharacterized protein n=1 Tax=Nematocida homosporus TaxID=1912981 RepID=UPI00221FE28D|nr:uncharacterized protein NEHOM01_0430 [Nematocida homosporus]KAI5184828.1 hypothetical protein NEHOM01_0430 [Nematocida homosporus]